jgi:GDPmannose 4,6-dehydratase
VETLLGDKSKAKAKPGWAPKITAQQMCAEMETDALQAAMQHTQLRVNGFAATVCVE